MKECNIRLTEGRIERNKAENRFSCKVLIGTIALCYKKVKCKAISLQIWTGPERYSKLRLSDFKTIGT